MNSLRSAESPDEIVVYLSDTNIHEAARMQSLGTGLLAHCRRAASDGKRLIVDFSGVQFMSSAMIGKFVLLNKMAKQHSVPLKLQNLSRNVQEVFRVIGRRFGGDDDDGLLGCPVPRPKPPNSDGGMAEPPQE
jgi:anti-sigma B factor antagonist